MMKNIVKAFYILVVAIVVFAGALLIIQGLKENQGSETAVTIVERAEPSFDNEAGSDA